MNIVPTTIPYNSILLKENLSSLVKTYNFLSLKTIGKSILNDYIYAIKLGTGPYSVFYSGSFHANEWITSILLMHFIEDYCKSFISNSSLLGYNIKKIFYSSSIYIVPMVNPDGVNLVTNLYNKESSEYNTAFNISKKFDQIPFSNGWKSNISRHRLKLTISCRLGKSKRNQI